MADIKNESTEPTAKPTRKAKWATPTVKQVRAGDAEFGNGVIDDGYGFGS